MGRGGRGGLTECSLTKFTHLFEKRISFGKTISRLSCLQHFTIGRFDFLRRQSAELTAGIWNNNNRDVWVISFHDEQIDGIMGKSRGGGRDSPA